MRTKSNPFVFIPGSGGGAPDLSMLWGAQDNIAAFEVIKYPGWRRCIDPKISGDVLVSELSSEAEARVPAGPLRMVGLSLGGHFAYLVALCLQERGRQVELVCAIDSFMVTTNEPTSGWQRRAFGEFFEYLGKFRLAELMRFGRSRFWRAMLRAIGDKLPRLLSAVSRSDWISRALDIDPILKQELDMRMLIRVVAPWLATIDDHPIRLSTPVALVRTESSANSDAAWQARCSNLRVFEIKGAHHSLFEPDNIGSLRDAFLTATGLNSCP